MKHYFIPTDFGLPQGDMGLIERNKGMPLWKKLALSAIAVSLVAWVAITLADSDKLAMKECRKKHSFDTCYLILKGF